MGPLSDGGVYSHITTCLPCWRWPKAGTEPGVCPRFLDGRDVPRFRQGLCEKLMKKCKRGGRGQVATVMGRHAMDRDSAGTVQRAYDAMTRGEGVQNLDPVDAVLRSYDAG